MKKFILSLSIAFLFSLHINAQTKFDVPKNVQLKAGSDYPKYKDDIINAAKWLEETDLDKDIAKRKEVDAFIIQWISGTPDITVAVTEGHTKLYGDNTELMIVFLASYSRNFLENQNATKETATKAGVISMMNVYKKGIAIAKNKEMEKAIKANDNGKLDKYITDNNL